MAEPSDKSTDPSGEEQPFKQLSVRWSSSERRRIRNGARSLHLKAESQFVRMAVMRLLDEVESGRIEVRAPRDSSANAD
jgi:hypothetical protein